MAISTINVSSIQLQSKHLENQKPKEIERLIDN